jgi:hypothetical protein
MPLLFSPEFIPTCLLQLQSFLFSLHGEVPLLHSPVEHATLKPLLDTFSSPSTLGEVAPLLPSLAYLQFAWGIALHPSSGAFHTTATVTSFPCPKVAGWGLPLLPSLAGLFIYSSCEECPSSSLQSSVRPALFVTCIFFFSSLFIIQLYFFSPGQGSVCPGCYADLSQGVLRAAYLLTWWSPKQGRSWCLAAWEPFWFLCLTWCGDAMHGLGVWRCWSLASSWWFFLPGVSPASLQEFTLGNTLSASSL